MKLSGVVTPELRQVHDPFGAMDDVTIRMLLSHSSGFQNPTWPYTSGQPRRLRGGMDRDHPRRAYAARELMTRPLWPRRRGQATLS